MDEKGKRKKSFSIAVEKLKSWYLRHYYAVDNVRWMLAAIFACIAFIRTF